MEHNLNIPRREEHAQYLAQLSEQDINVRPFFGDNHHFAPSQREPGVVQGYPKHAATAFVTHRVLIPEADKMFVII